MIDAADYFMGRDAKYPEELTDELRRNALVTVGRVNRLLEEFGENFLISMERVGLKKRDLYLLSAMPEDASRTVWNSDHHMTRELVDSEVSLCSSSRCFWIRSRLRTVLCSLASTSLSGISSR